jgi:hypothetical protein
MKLHAGNQPASPLIKALLIGILAIVIFMEAWCGYQVYRLSAEKRKHKLAYAFTNNVSFGLLSVDVWRDQVVATTRKELGEFRLSAAQEKESRKEIDAQLHKLVSQAFTNLEKPKKSLGDKLKKAAIKTLVEQDEVEKELPGYSRRLMAVLTSPASYKRITNIADTAITQISRKIYDSSAASTKLIMDSIYRQYGATDKVSFAVNNATLTHAIKKQTYRYAYGMMLGVAVVFGLWIILHRNRNLQAILYILSAISTLVLLWVGISTTIIEIDATLAKMDIRFLNGSLSFRGQSLFFQSQSIIDVLRLLIGSGRITSVVVGLMILTFTILFPVIILAATSMAVASPNKLARNSVIDYLAFHAGKWNMSDVMVLAILMTFIGFNGIVDSTLTELNYTESSITSVTSNNTVIEPGYAVYTAFVAFSIALGIILKRIRKKQLAEQQVDIVEIV